MAYETVDAFDRIRQQVADAPHARETRPRTIAASPNPLSNDSHTDYIVSTVRVDDPIEGSRLASFVRMLDAEGGYRIVLPHSVVDAIRKQSDSLFDRSTPESRRRKQRSNELRRNRKAAHEAGKHDNRDTPMRGCPGCERA